MLFGFLKSRKRDAAGAMYAALVRQARHRAFYTSYGVPDTVDGRFDMIVLTVFFALRRLTSDAGRDGAKDIAQALFDYMFRDMDRSLREMGVGDLSVGKHIRGMAEAYYGRVNAYEKGLAEGDEVLSEALRRNLYRHVRPTEPELASMRRWMRASAAALDGVSFRHALRGGFPYPDPTAFVVAGDAAR